VAVALELDADHASPSAGPRQDVVEASVEREDAPVQRDERRSRRVAELLVPDGDAVDLVKRHACDVRTGLMGSSIVDDLAGTNGRSSACGAPGRDEGVC
jgi:hypothetical protein